MAFLCLAALAGAGETYYVDCENGDDAYAGTDIGSAAHPYASIGKALAMDAADLGDSEIVVRRGTYKLGGTPIVKNAYCTLRGETGNPEDVVIDAEGLSYSRALSEPQV